MPVENTQSFIFDPLGIEIFAIDETFESVFIGLRGVYFRLFYKESKKPVHAINQHRKEAYFSRYKEIGVQKNQYRYNEWLKKRDAVVIYGIELKKMLAVELSEYRTFTNADDYK